MQTPFMWQSSKAGTFELVFCTTMEVCSGTTTVIAMIVENFGLSVHLLCMMGVI